MVKNYATQYCASKSLPFSAAVMALDCVSAAFASVVGDNISANSISDLITSGHKKEVCTVFMGYHKIYERTFNVSLCYN